MKRRIGIAFLAFLALAGLCSASILLTPASDMPSVGAQDLTSLYLQQELQRHNAEVQATAAERNRIIQATASSQRATVAAATAQVQATNYAIQVANQNAQATTQAGNTTATWDASLLIGSATAQAATRQTEATGTANAVIAADTAVAATLQVMGTRSAQNIAATATVQAYNQQLTNQQVQDVLTAVSRALLIVGICVFIIGGAYLIRLAGRKIRAIRLANRDVLQSEPPHLSEIRQPVPAMSVDNPDLVDAIERALGDSQ